MKLIKRELILSYSYWRDTLERRMAEIKGSRGVRYPRISRSGAHVPERVSTAIKESNGTT